jgi:hypothetical protein
VFVFVFEAFGAPVVMQNYCSSLLFAQGHSSDIHTARESSSH